MIPFQEGLEMAESESNRQVPTTSSRAAAQGKRWNLVWFGGLAGVLVAALIVAIVVSVVGGDSEITPLEGLAAGLADAGPEGMAPDFSLTLYQGSDKLGAETLNLSQLQGRPVVLNFWAGLCPPCRAEMPDLQRFYNESKDEVLLLGIDVGQFTGLGNREDAQTLLQELDITYPAGFTGDASIMQKYEVLGMPTTVFIDSNGEIFRNWTGVLDRETLEQVTSEMLKAEARPIPGQ
jgi:thiol-disulfide isomerase/thioredoxin